MVLKLRETLLHVLYFVFYFKKVSHTEGAGWGRVRNTQWARLPDGTSPSS